MRIPRIGILIGLGVLMPAGVLRAEDDQAHERAARSGAVRQQVEALRDMEAADTDEEYKAAERRFDTASGPGVTKRQSTDDGEAADEAADGKPATDGTQAADGTAAPDDLGADDSGKEDEGLSFHLPPDADDASDDDDDE